MADSVITSTIGGGSLSNTGVMASGAGSGGVGGNDDWDQAFKYMMKKHPIDHQEHQQELFRMQEIKKRNVLNNALRLPMQQQPHSQQQPFPFGGGGVGASVNNDFDYYLMQNSLGNSGGVGGGQVPHLQHQHAPMLPNPGTDHSMGHNAMYKENMSKFFDFHKNQQNQVRFRRLSSRIIVHLL